MREKAGFGIYNGPKKLQIAERLHGLQNILRAELMAVHKMLTILTTTYNNEPANIFTDCVNVLYLLNTQIQHPPCITTTLTNASSKTWFKCSKSEHKLPTYIKLEHMSTSKVTKRPTS